MAEMGVPREVGMRKTGHVNANSYSKYDRTLEAQTRAAERCVLENISYAEALELETREFRISTIKGPGSDANVTEVVRPSGAKSSGVGVKRSIEVEEIAPKRGRTRTKDEGKSIYKLFFDFLLMSSADTKCEFLLADSELTHSVSVQVRKLRLAEDSVPVAAGYTRVRPVRVGKENKDLEFAKSYDWDSDLKLWEEEQRKSESVNPIREIFGQLVNCPGMTINFNGPVNFKA
jgi:hypothetical protein